MLYVEKKIESVVMMVIMVSKFSFLKWSYLIGWGDVSKDQIIALTSNELAVLYTTVEFLLRWSAIINHPVIDWPGGRGDGW